MPILCRFSDKHWNIKDRRHSICIKTYFFFSLCIYYYLALCVFLRKWQPTPVFLPGESQGPGILVGCRLWGCTESDTTEVTQQQRLSEKAMAPHSSTLAWKIPWMEEPGGPQSMGLLRVGHDWVTSFHFSLSCIGEGNGNPLQCSCLENPRDRGAWWAAVYGVAQSWTRLKRLSSSNSSSVHCWWVI